MTKEQIQILMSKALVKTNANGIELTDDLYNELKISFWHQIEVGIKYAMNRGLDSFVNRYCSIVPVYIDLKYQETVWEWFLPKMVKELNDMKIPFSLEKEVKRNMFMFHIKTLKQFIDLKDIVEAPVSIH